MAIQIIKRITKLEVDAIVNAANSQLQAGGGVCGAIFEEAGYKELTAACRKIGHCETGSAVITPGFSLKAKYIIHAVGPIWNGGNSGEAKLLHTPRKNEDTRCLCGSCLSSYMNGKHIVKRSKPYNRIKEPCEICGRPGYDYLISERRYEVRKKETTGNE